MSWDLATPPKGLGMALAVTLGRAYPRDATGYEYQPAPARWKKYPRKGGGTFTSQGALARKRHAWICCPRYAALRTRSVERAS